MTPESVVGNYRYTSMRIHRYHTKLLPLTTPTVQIGYWIALILYLLLYKILHHTKRWHLSLSVVDSEGLTSLRNSIS